MGLSFADAEGHVWSLGRHPGGTSDSIFTRDDASLASFNFRDQLRDESISEVQRLQQRRLDVFILSGDREAKVAETAAQLSLARDHWQHSLTPDQKAAWVREHDAHDTLYVGDGANDSLAFDAASCAGSPVTGRSFLEHKADFYFLGHSMRFATGLLDVAAQHRKAVHRVFAFALSYNIATVVAGLLGHLSPLAAAVLMPLSSVATLSLVAITFRRRATVQAPAGSVAAEAFTRISASRA
jgi:P-type Cu2+ transporter